MILIKKKLCGFVDDDDSSTVVVHALENYFGEGVSYFLYSEYLYFFVCILHICFFQVGLFGMGNKGRRGGRGVGRGVEHESLLCVAKRSGGVFLVSWLLGWLLGWRVNG